MAWACAWCCLMLSHLWLTQAHFQSLDSAAFSSPRQPLVGSGPLELAAALAQFLVLAPSRPGHAASVHCSYGRQLTHHPSLTLSLDPDGWPACAHHAVRALLTALPRATIQGPGKGQQMPLGTRSGDLTRSKKMAAVPTPRLLPGGRQTTLQDAYACSPSFHSLLLTSTGTSLLILLQP